MDTEDVKTVNGVGNVHLAGTNTGATLYTKSDWSPRSYGVLKGSCSGPFSKWGAGHGRAFINDHVETIHSGGRTRRLVTADMRGWQTARSRRGIAGRECGAPSL
jgi:hypothetical protein